MTLAKSTKIILIVSIFLLIAQVVVSSKLTAIGRNVSKVKEETDKLDRNNQELEQRIASESSLLVIEERAKQIGLKQPAEIQFMDDAVYVAQR